MMIHGARPRSDPEAIKARLAELSEAFRALLEVLHKCDGTQPGNPFGMRGMAVAKTYLDTAWLWAKDTVEEN